MKFSSFTIIMAAGLAIAAPITPVSTDKTLTIQPVEVAKRQTTLDPVVDAAHGKLPVPVKRADELSGLFNGLQETKGSTVAGAGEGLGQEKRGLPDASALTGAVPGGLPTSSLPVGKRQLGGLLPTSSSTDDGSETAEEPKIPKEPKEPSSVTDGTTEIDDGTAKSSTSSAASALGGLPIGKRQLDGLTKGLFPTPDAEPAAEGDAASGDEAAAEPAAEEETEEPAEEEAASADGKTAEEAAPAKNATEPAPAKTEKAGGLLGSLGM